MAYTQRMRVRQDSLPRLLVLDHKAKAFYNDEPGDAQSEEQMMAFLERVAAGSVKAEYEDWKVNVWPAVAVRRHQTPDTRHHTSQRQTVNSRQQIAAHRKPTSAQPIDNGQKTTDKNTADNSHSTADSSRQIAVSSQHPADLSLVRELQERRSAWCGCEHYRSAISRPLSTASRLGKVAHESHSAPWRLTGNARPLVEKGPQVSAVYVWPQLPSPVSYLPIASGGQTILGPYLR